jgi:hypothetical protein
MPYVQVEVELDEFSDSELIKELEYRGHKLEKEADALFKIRTAYIMESPERFRKTLEQILDENGMRV